MAFVDEVRVQGRAGRGGDGVVRWLRTKETARGGPSGGDGGRGGDVVLVGVRDLAALAQYRFEKNFAAENGEAGRNELKQGASGADYLLKVPVGTVAHVAATGKAYEITSEGEQLVILRGGQAGKGNARFKSSTHQNPFESTPGRAGEESEIRLTLKIIADVGLVGLPNAGKSSLLNSLTRAKSKVGDYAFTTLEPHLGDFYGYIIADIPGLIEGASAGKGLGTKFLKHVERTGMLVHLVSASHDDVAAAYREVRNEIELFGHGLAHKKEVVVLSKADLCAPDELEIKRSQLEGAAGHPVIALSVLDDVALKRFADTLTQMLAPKAP